jgi:hypothetical protein
MAELSEVKLRLMDVRKDLIHEQIELTGCQNSSLDLSPQRLPPPLPWHWLSARYQE